MDLTNTTPQRRRGFGEDPFASNNTNDNNNNNNFSYNINMGHPEFDLGNGEEKSEYFF